MKKLLIASDIHGSAYYCEKLMERIKEENADRILLLGDLLYHGPRNDLPRDYAPKRVIEMLNSLTGDLLCVRGNCDTEVDQMVLNFPIMAEYAFVAVGNEKLFVTHGHHHGEKTPPPLRKGDILLCGHTHIPACNEYEDFTYMNPGSVAIPKKGSRYSYMTWENDEFYWKDVETGEVYHRRSRGRIELPG
jgi:putative phosphoesterase